MRRMPMLRAVLSALLGIVPSVPIAQLATTSDVGRFTFGTPRYFEMHDGVLVEVSKPSPPDPNASTTTVTAIDRDAGTITLKARRR